MRKTITNMPATETFLRHFAMGQGYFASRFGKAPLACAFFSVASRSSARRA